MEAFFTNAAAFMIFLLGFTLFISGGSTQVNMKVVGVKTNLPIIFFDSPSEGRGDIMHYPFELQSQTPLTLVEVKISNEKESKSLKYFEPDYNITSLFGEPLSDFIVLLEEPSEGFSQNEAKLYSKTRFMTSETLEPDCWQKESGPAIEYLCEDDLSVLFVFKEGTAKVSYKFLDKEIMHAPLFHLAT